MPEVSFERPCLETVRSAIGCVEDEQLKSELTEFCDAVFMELPERREEMWRTVFRIVQKHLPPGDKEDLEAWQIKLVSILTGEPE